jgi:hypothetical protein
MNTATRTHVVTGDRDQVCAALERAHAAGRLVDVRDVAELHGRRLHVVAELRELPDRRPGWWPARPWVTAAYAVGAAATAGLVVLVVMAVAALVSAVVGAITAALAWVTANLALILAVGVALLLMTGGAKCAGLHCGGCRR